ncbi:MAG TPA: hypothetical protein VM848_04785 [Acidimicrobiia bacterium]|nr:hypothetical protein [Acidimicrobiia bacterium]
MLTNLFPRLAARPQDGLHRFEHVFVDQWLVAAGILDALPRDHADVIVIR